MIATMIEKLKKVNFICKVKYHEWLENIFLVKKKNIQLWICIELWDINQECLKEAFLLPIPDNLLDYVVRCQMFSFMKRRQLPMHLLEFIAIRWSHSIWRTEDYVDDIIFKSRTRKDRCEVLWKVLQWCRDNNLKLNPKSVLSTSHRDNFLSRPAKIQTIRDMNLLTSLRKVQSFLKKINQIQRFIPDLSSKVLLFTQLLNKRQLVRVKCVNKPSRR